MPAARQSAILARYRAKLSNGAWLPMVRRLPDAGRVGLSFDDGPSPASTPEILRLLRAADATASFFLTGERAEAHPDLVRSIIDGGHDVFAHGWRHIHYTTVTPQALVADLQRAEAVLARVRPTPSPYLVRLPYGSGHALAWVHRALRAWHPAPQIADWDHSTEDWRLADGCTESGQVHAACVAAADRAILRPRFRGSILLAHEDPYGVTAPLVAQVAPFLLAEILDRLGRLGLAGSKIQPLGAQCPLRRYIRSW